MMTSSPTTKPLNLMWAGAGLGVFLGIGIVTLSLVVLMIWATVDASGTPGDADTATMWLFGGVMVVMAMFPAAIIGALMGAVVGSVYKGRSQRMPAVGATLVGAGVGVIVLLLSYWSVQGLVGSSEWEGFLAAYAGDGGTALLIAPYTLFVLGGFILVSHALNRRLP